MADHPWRSGLLTAVAALALGACGMAGEPTGGPADAASAPVGGEDVVAADELAAAADSLAARDDALEEWYGAVVDCVHDKGWEGVQALTDGLAFDDLPREQDGAFQDDLAACKDTVGPQAYSEPLSRAEIAVIYHRWVDAKACLEDLGYEISDPPSENVFVDDYRHAEDGPWSPFLDLPQSTDLRQVQDQCPQ